MGAFAIDPTNVRDISGLLLDGEGRLRTVSAGALAATTPEERLLFGMRFGIYSFPTEELVCFLRERIAGRTAIEIGAGHGALAKALSIHATDSHQQDDPAFRVVYESLGQPTVPYGANVERLPADQAVARYRPKVVIACWVTHRFDPRRPEAGGNEAGVDEGSIIAACDEYIFIGNEQVHRHKPIWNLPHEKITPSWVSSRAMNGSRDFIAIWPGSAEPASDRGEESQLQLW